MSALGDVASPLAYLLATVAFVLGVKSIARVKVAARAQFLLALALVLGVGGLAADGRLAAVPLSALGASALGVVLGWLVVRRSTALLTPARLATMPALAGAAAAIVSARALPGLATIEAGIAVIAIVLGAAALLAGAAVAALGGSSVRTSVASALVAALAGWAIAGLGFALGNAIVVVAGGLGGTTAMALARLVAAAASRRVTTALLTSARQDEGYANVRACGTEEAAMLLDSANTILVVPGFGMPAAGAQHTVKELAEQLEKRGARVIWAVHPVAGCLPGHMNIALDEANVSHENLVELGAAQEIVTKVDAVLVVGANDTVNASAAGDVGSPLYGLPALDLAGARAVFVVKRTLRAGAAGVRNPLFEGPNTMMMFGDSKRVMQGLVAALKSGAAH